VWAFALAILIIMVEDGILSQTQANEQGEENNQWLEEHGVDSSNALQLANQVFEDIGPGGQGPGGGPGTGFGGGQGDPGPQGDEWGQSLENQLVDSGSISGENAALWRVYKDNLGDFERPFYFMVWRKGQYTKIGSYASAPAAKQAAIDLILAPPPQQGGIAGNPRMANTALSRRMLARRTPRGGCHTVFDCSPCPPGLTRKCSKGRCDCAQFR
jgi:hypothetical protein